MFKPFTEIKRIISQHFEINYWYKKRKINSLWYDEDDKKWYKSSHLTRARDITASTWEGEDDILNMMLLRVDHMFWNLKKYGIEKNYYIYGNDVIKYGTKEDKRFLINEALKETFKTESRVYVFDGNIDLGKLGITRCMFFLNYNKNTLVLTCTYKKDKTVENIVIEKWKVNDEDFGAIALNVDLSYSSSFQNIKNMYNIVPHLESTFLDDIILSQLEASISYSFPIPEVHKLSKKLREHAIGNFVKCKDLLHLRHLIKNILKINDLNPVYNTWQNVKDTEKQQKIEECAKLFKNDRKQACRRLADFIAEKALNWWD